jgi:hypothetical protein
VRERAATSASSATDKATLYFLLMMYVVRVCFSSDCGVNCIACHTHSDVVLGRSRFIRMVFSPLLATTAVCRFGTRSRVMVLAVCNSRACRSHARACARSTCCQHRVSHKAAYGRSSISAAITSLLLLRMIGHRCECSLCVRVFS